MKKIFMILAMMVGLMMTGVAQTTLKKMAVAAFDVNGNAVTKDEAEAITELYISELVSTGKVTVIDRMNFDKIIQEMKFQSSDWSDKEKTAALGNAVNAQIITRGQVIKLGSKFYLSTTVIDVKSAAILASARKQFNTIDDIFSLLPTLASELLASINYKIGDIGPGGGIIYYIDGNMYYECTGLLGKAKFDDANKMCQDYRGGGFADWYLPTITDLVRIYKSLNCIGINAPDETFWSSSRLRDGWARMRFSDGYHDYYGLRGETNCVRAVRAFIN